MEEINQLESVRGMGALLNSDEAAYAESLIARSAIVAVIVPIVGQLIGLKVIGHLSRGLARSIGVAVDVQSIAGLPQNAQEWWVNE